MNNISKKIKQVLYLTLSFLTLIAGYAFLRYAYKVTDSFPFTQEIVLIILGTVATVFITAMLLNQQTSVEIEKEQRIKFLDLKTSTYEKLLDLLESMSAVDNFTERELTKLQFITHRLAIVASPGVLDEYRSFLKIILKISGDNSFIGDSEKLHKALSELTKQIRHDLIGDVPSEGYSDEYVNNLISQNSRSSTKIKHGL